MTWYVGGFASAKSAFRLYLGEARTPLWTGRPECAVEFETSEEAERRAVALRAEGFHWAKVCSDIEVIGLTLGGM